MNKYLTILNAVMLGLLIIEAVFVRPYVGGWPLTIGCFAGAIFSAGLLSWKYDHGTVPHDEQAWLQRIFSKDYGVEAIARLTMMVLFGVLSQLYWKGFHFFLMGFFLMWTVALGVEYCYGTVHHFFGYGHTKKDDIE